MTLAALPLPTRRDEAFRYSDVNALAGVWPVAVESITIAAGLEWSSAIVNTAPTDDVFVRHLAITLEPGARGRLQILNAGGRLGRIVVDVTCHAHSDFALSAVQLGSNNQTVELVTTITHAQPGATSNQQVRSVLGGAATGTYLGKVAVARDAQGTDSEQSVKAMLLDRTATANAKPELEIYADDVKCAHGCAVGELDQDALFYLAARGLSPSDAKSLLLQAFIASVFDGAEDEEMLTATALAKLGEMV
ncbi:MAG: SufD family Fe-S cluster assembly protein [Sphingopyxis sp.]